MDTTVHNLREHWESAVNHTRARSPASFDPWFSSIQLVTIDAQQLVLRSRDPFVRDWVSEHYLPSLLQYLRLATGISPQVSWTIGTIESPVIPPAVGEDAPATRPLRSSPGRPALQRPARTHTSIPALLPFGSPPPSYPHATPAPSAGPGGAYPTTYGQPGAHAHYPEDPYSTRGAPVHPGAHPAAHPGAHASAHQGAHSVAHQGAHSAHQGAHAAPHAGGHPASHPGGHPASHPGGHPASHPGSGLPASHPGSGHPASAHLAGHEAPGSYPPGTMTAGYGPPPSYPQHGAHVPPAHVPPAHALPAHVPPAHGPSSMPGHGPLSSRGASMPGHASMPDHAPSSMPGSAPQGHAPSMAQGHASSMPQGHAPSMPGYASPSMPGHAPSMGGYAMPIEGSMQAGGAGHGAHLGGVQAGAMPVSMHGATMHGPPTGGRPRLDSNPIAPPISVASSPYPSLAAGRGAAGGPSSSPRPDARASLPAPDGLNTKYTFENFIVGPSNELAYAAAYASSGGGGRRYSPLFLCGGTGLGKTHLLQAVGHNVLADQPGKRIIYVSAERFTNDFIAAIQNKRMDAFRAHYRGDCDLLLVDDIQFLAGREQTQEEFFHTFNALHELDRPIVFTSDKYPQQLERMEERLVSRFSWGLVADVQAPELETRVAIVRKKAQVEGIPLDDQVALFLAQTISSNVRELEGTLIRLAAKASLTNRPIDLAFAQGELTNVSGRGRVLSIDDIQRAVCTHFHLRPADLMSKDRHKTTAFARHIAMYLCKQKLPVSFPEVGRAFGKDHTTVMSAVRKVESLRDQDAQVRAHLESIEKKLAG